MDESIELKCISGVLGHLTNFGFFNDSVKADCSTVLSDSKSSNPLDFMHESCNGDGYGPPLNPSNLPATETVETMTEDDFAAYNPD